MANIIGAVLVIVLLFGLPALLFMMSLEVILHVFWGLPSLNFFQSSCLFIGLMIVGRILYGMAFKVKNLFENKEAILWKKKSILMKYLIK